MYTRRVAFVAENKDSPSWVMLVNCPTLCPLDFLLLEFTWLCQGAQEYVPNHNDAMREILDLQRDLQANNFVRYEEYNFGIRTLLFSFPFLVIESVVLCSTLRVSPRPLLTLQRSAFVSWRLGCVFLPPMALLLPLEFPTSFWRSE